MVGKVEILRGNFRFSAEREGRGGEARLQKKQR